MSLKLAIASYWESIESICTWNVHRHFRFLHRRIKITIWPRLTFKTKLQGQPIKERGLHQLRRRFPFSITSTCLLSISWPSKTEHSNGQKQYTPDVILIHIRRWRCFVLYALRSYDENVKLFDKLTSLKLTSFNRLTFETSFELVTDSVGGCRIKQILCKRQIEAIIVTKWVGWWGKVLLL